MAEKVNLRPDGFAEGGGLIDDFDGVISDIRFTMTDYGGSIQEKIPCARVVFDIDGEEDVSLYSVGGKGDFAPDDTGMGLIVLKSKGTLTKKSKFGMLLGSIVKAGFPLNQMDAENIGYLVGLKGHFLRKVVEYKGLAKKKDEREPTVLLCTKVLELPGEAVKGKRKGKGKGKAAVVDSGLADALAMTILGLLADSDDPIAKTDMLSSLFKVPNLPGDKKSAIKLAQNDEYLSGRDEWTLEDGILKMAD